MKLLRRLILTTLILTQVLTPVSFAAADMTPSTPTITVSDPQPELASAPLLLTSYMTDSLPIYVQIYNTSSDLVALADYTLDFSVQAMDDTVLDVSLPLSGYIKPKSYIVIARDDLVANADQTYTLTVDSVDFKEVKSLQISTANYAPDVRATDFLPATRYDLSQTSAGNYTKAQTFIATQLTVPLVGGGYYNYAGTTAVRVVEFLANAANCAPLEENANCYDFVELQNQGDAPIDLAGYRLRTGYGNVTASISTSVALDGILLPGEFMAVAKRDDQKPLDIVASGGNIWLEDAYGLHTYADTVVTYGDLSDVTHEGLSWAYDSSDSAWKWATPTPGAVNDFVIAGRGSAAATDNPSTAETVLKPCAANQFRNPETNRCKLIAATLSTSLVPCAADQYRSAETNRCRSIDTILASSPVPCSENQFRNPETGRCKLLANAADTTLKPCPTGQERNPDTNRCRKVSAATMPAAAFPVEAIKDSGKAFVGWYALGGVVLLGVAYGAFEWRHEIGRLIAKAVTVVRSK